MNASTARGPFYVGNMTKQTHQFEFRLTNQKVPRRVDIEALSQINVAGYDGLTGMEIEQIVSQHRRYGMIPVSEVDHTKPYFGLVYSTDKPITVSNFQLALKHNEEMLKEQGREIRQKAALATQQTLAKDETLNRMGANIEELEMSVIEQETKNNPEPEFAEGVVVRETDGERDSDRGSRKRKGR